MSNPKVVHIVLFGIGNVGSTLIDQIVNVRSKILKQIGLQIKIAVIANSKLAFYNKDGISNTWQSHYKTFSSPYKIQEIVNYVKEKAFDNLIAIDTTSSSSFVEQYGYLIENGFHIVSANKLANTWTYSAYKALRDSLKKHDKQFLYETNVGAGLPIIETVKGLFDSGENVHKIRGVFSGSLSYIFNEFSAKDISFSKVIKQASKIGLTEPDTREDLSGKDVARKLIILARELDLKSEIHDVSIESLVPKKLNKKATLHQFNKRINELDIPFQKRKERLNKNSVLRYVGELDVIERTLQVKLISANKNSPLGQLKGADSIFEIFTDSYKDTPLIIQGAGAGKEVTARGVLSDILKLSISLN